MRCAHGVDGLGIVGPLALPPVSEAAADASEHLGRQVTATSVAAQRVADRTVDESLR